MLRLDAEPPPIAVRTSSMAMSRLLYHMLSPGISLISWATPAREGPHGRHPIDEDEVLVELDLVGLGRALRREITKRPAPLR